LGKGVLGVPDFRRLWLAGLGVSVARWLEMLVISVVVWQITESAFLVAAMMLLRIAPMGLFGAIVGVLSDRVERRSVLLGVLALQGGSVAMLGLLSIDGHPAVWVFALASFVSGAGWATDHPVRRKMMGDILGVARMGTGMSIDVMAQNATRMAGPALGGTLLATLGEATAFLICALVYAVSFACALRLEHRGRSVGAPRGRLLGELADSFRFGFGHPSLRGVLVVTMIFNAFAWPCSSMVPVIGQAAHGLGPDGTGLLASMDGVGALAGAALIGWLARADRYAAIYVGGVALYLVMALVFALAPSPVPAGLALVILGIGNSGFGTMQATLVYMVTPPELRGRALGVLSAVIGTGILGFLNIGLLAAWLGPVTATMVAAVMGLVALAVTWPVWRRVTL
jgi:MFS family permease